MQKHGLIRKGNDLLKRGEYGLLARKSSSILTREALKATGLRLRSIYPGMGLGFILCREEFPHLLNARKLTGEGVEIGVLRGDHSVDLLESWTGQKLYSVDPWRPFSPEVYRDNDNRNLDEQEMLYRQTAEKLNRFGTRSEILRMTSAEAAPRFHSGQLDFVYIDAQHHYEAVKEDIELWHSKVKHGGILAGHDYLDGSLATGEFGVKRAVDEFARNAGLVVHASREPDYPSWFIEI